MEHPSLLNSSLLQLRLGFERLYGNGDLRDIPLVSRFHRHYYYTNYLCRLPPPPREFAGAPIIPFSPLLYIPPLPRELAPIIPFSPLPYIPPPPPPGQVLQFKNRIQQQVHYYFSDENLIKDLFLRQHMDHNGWVPLALIVGFRMMRCLTDDITLVSLALQDSTIVELHGDKVRKRSNWARWVLPSSF